MHICSYMEYISVMSCPKLYLGDTGAQRKKKIRKKEKKNKCKMFELVEGLQKLIRGTEGKGLIQI